MLNHDKIIFLWWCFTALCEKPPSKGCHVRSSLSFSLIRVKSFVEDGSRVDNSRRLMLRAMIKTHVIICYHIFKSAISIIVVEK